MDHANIIRALANNRAVFEAMFSGVSSEAQLWKPAPDKWCLLEVVCHLYDEEREDFRARVRHCLESPDAPMPSIDPQGWVTKRDYLGQEYPAKLDAFLEERTRSVEWLRNLQDPQWENAYQHPRFGPLSAQLFLSNWLAHDFLHFRQITRLKYQYLDQHFEEPLDYAGGW